MQRKIKSKKSANPNNKMIRILLSVLGVLIVGAVIVGIVLAMRITSNQYDSLLERDIVLPEGDEPQITNPFTNAPPVSKTVVYNGKTYQKNDDIVNLLLLGIDSNSERRQQNMGYRSDMVMVCAVNTQTKEVTLISIPRDTYTTVYKMDNDGKVTQTIQERVNAAYAFGSRGKRAENAMACVQMFLQRENELEESLDFALDIPVYFYGSIDMDGISALSSAVGGVEVTLDSAVPGLGKKGDRVVLKGYDTEHYVRIRKDAGGDIGRAGRQRTFMLSLAKKIKSMGAVDIMVSLWNKMERYSEKNFGMDQMLDFAKILMKVDLDSIRQESIPGRSEKRGSDNSDVWIHDEKATLEMLLDVYYDEVG